MFWGFLLLVLFMIIFLIKILVAGILLPFFILYIIIQCFFLNNPDIKSLNFGSYKGDYARCSVLLGKAKISVHNETIIKQGPLLEYKTIAGSSTIDLTQLDIQALRSIGQTIIVQSNNSFGNLKLKISKNIPVYITAKGFLGHIQLPDDTKIIIGSHTYMSHPQERPALIIYNTTILGKTTVEQI
jgi:hypothetical protein